MAKELPYFKFFVSEWSDGDVCLESMEAQGLFINICAYYWSNECDLTIEKCLKKFQHHDQKLIKTLIESGLIKDKDGVMHINFLDEQRKERIALSTQNAKNVRKRYKNSTVVESSYYENTTIKKREEKKREDKSLLHHTEWFDSLNSNQELLQSLSRLNLNPIDAINNFIEENRLAGMKSETDLRMHCYNWNKKQNANGNKKPPKNLGFFVS